jgi:hypothetical protein
MRLSISAALGVAQARSRLLPLNSMPTTSPGPAARRRSASQSGGPARSATQAQLVGAT